MDPISVLVGAGIGAGACLLVLYLIRSDLTRRRSELLASATREMEARQREAEIRIKDQELRLRTEMDQKAETMREGFREHERRVSRQESACDQRAEQLASAEKLLRQRDADQEETRKDLAARQGEHQALVERARDDLLRIAGMDREQATAEVIERFREEVREETAGILQKAQERIEEEAEVRAQKILSTCMQRLAVTYTADSVTSAIQLQSDEMKGRIIGREGRNIRAIEKATGVDVIIDDTPGMVVVSCFDNVRREVARRSLERLVEDGRIHPGRIEETVAQEKSEIENDIRQTARKVLHELDIPRVDARIQHCLGRLKYRTSFGQNQLEHAVEVSYLAGAIASELRLDPKLAKRCGLLHDVGKALDHEMEGGHPAIGADLARRCGEPPEVVNAIAAHHGDVPYESVYAVIAQLCDAISAARPGARRDTMEKYIQRLEKLEKIATSFRGVAGAFAIQAGREIRVVVDATAIDDAAAQVLAREIAKGIEAQLVYPGEVRVTIIRETRVTEYAR